MRVVLVFSKDVAATYAASEAGSIGSPRWPMTFEAAKRAVGVMVLLLTLVLLLTPVPLSNIAPAIVISLISLAYVEQDGLLLSAAFLAAIILIGIGSILLKKDFEGGL
jgi:hypothetical protein